MKVMGRVLLIVGLLYVLTPCPCQDSAQAFAASCPLCNHGNDCCGDEGTPSSSYCSMDQRTIHVSFVQIFQPNLVSIAVPVIFVSENSAFLGTRSIYPGHSPPQSVVPLRI